ncbi:MAG: TIGR04255 family protein [Ferrimicrobium sp.]
MYDGREVFPNPPLEYVAVELRFPFAPKLNRDEIYEVLSQQLSTNFPLIEKGERPPGFSISPQGAQQVPKLTLWRLLDRTRTISITTTTNSLAIETTAYSGYEAFKSCISQVLNTFQTLDIVAGVERIGMRYINELRLPAEQNDIRQWHGYISDSILALTRIADRYSPSALEGAIQMNIGSGKSLTLRYASLIGKGIVGAEGPLHRKTTPPEGPFMVIDIDSYWSSGKGETPPFKQESILTTLDDLHDPIGHVFMNCISDKFKDEVMRKEFDA